MTCSSASHCFHAYDEFLAFLVQTLSEESVLYHANITNDLYMCRREVGEAVSYLDDRIQRYEDEQMSQPSRRSSAMSVARVLNGPKLMLQGPNCSSWKRSLY